MRILADANMPGLARFASIGPVETVEGRDLSAQQLEDAQVLLVRSVTRVDEALLAGSQVRFVGSATIGTDHVDRDYLQRAGIAFAHAPGCNARAVTEYVLQAVLFLCEQQSRDLRDCRAAVVGLGNVGRRVAGWLGAMGVTVQASDPPLARSGYSGPVSLKALDAILDADVISLHVPLTRSGPDATHHLLDARRLAGLQPEQMLINTCRGPVVDNQALLKQLEQGSGPQTVLDVWESEPAVPPALYHAVQAGSPHVAGYSLEGKLAGTDRLYHALCDFLEMPPQPSSSPVDKPLLEQGVSNQAELLALLQHAYRLSDDHRRLGESLQAPQPKQAFDALRKHYPLRHELHHWQHRGTVSEPWQGVVNRLFSEPD